MGKHRTSNIEHRTSNGRTTDGLVFHDGDACGRKYDLEERLLEFASAVIDLSEKLPNNLSGRHVAGQILRSGTSPLSNHGEADSAESREDFLHKLKFCLKELRETRRWAKLVERKGWADGDPVLRFISSESDELIRIFVSSIRTVQQNILKSKRLASDHSREAG
jgi:four helix bundle protein